MTEIITYLFGKSKLELPTCENNIVQIEIAELVSTMYIKLLKLIKKGGSNNSDENNNAEIIQRLEFLLRLRLFLLLLELLKVKETERIKGIEELKKYIDDKMFKTAFPQLLLAEDFINKIKNTLDLPLEKRSVPIPCHCGATPSCLSLWRRFSC
jgi:hypothetical protein